MAHWVGVYTDELPRLKSIIGSRASRHFKEALELCGGQFSSHRPDHNRIATHIEGLIRGAIPSGEPPDGAWFIRAFEALCRAHAHKAAVVEVAVDDEQFPEMWELVWGANEAPFGLPIAAEGSPACGHWGPQDVPGLVQTFRDLGNNEAPQGGRPDYRDEIAQLLEVLEAAGTSGQGVFVFFNE
jgi:hypothetical protein